MNADQDPDPDSESPQDPPRTEPLSEDKEGQINRMAGCARYGRWLVMLGLAFLLGLLLYRCQQ